jgi:alkaline phosphatase D
MKLIFISLILFFISIDARSQQSNYEKLRLIKNLDRIAFGSCNKQFSTQDLWKDLIQQRPDLFIWGGDNVYANTTTAANILKSYQLQNDVDDYRFFKSITPIIGTWDDHDYGNNDEDGHFSLKKISQEYALNFLEEPLFSPRRFRQGIYTSYNFGVARKKIKIIVLDNRYFMNLEKTAPLLGHQQWEWLKREVATSDASLHLVVSGLSVLSPSNPSSEEWEDFPDERIKLKSIMESRKVPYLYLTGDKHFSSIFKKNGETEFMSSGMTHNTRLPLRPWVRMKYPEPIFIHNYGLIDFLWDKNSPLLNLSIRSAEGVNLVQKKIKWHNQAWYEY